MIFDAIEFIDNFAFFLSILTGVEFGKQAEKAMNPSDGEAREIISIFQMPRSVWLLFDCFWFNFNRRVKERESAREQTKKTPAIDELHRMQNILKSY